MPRILATLVLLLAAMQAALAAAPATAAELSHEIVPATAEAKRNGEAAFIPLKDGSLLLLYGAHSKPGDWDRGEIRQIRSRDGGQTWSQPETVFSDPKRSLFQCALARLPSGDLGLTHTSLAHGQDAIKVFRRSSDEGKTWSEPIVISDKEYAYTTGPWDKLYVLESGRLIAILHCNLKPDAKKQGGPLGSYTVFSDDDGKTWKRSPASDVLHVADNPHKGNGRGHEWGFWEPSLVEHAPGKLLMLGRTTTGWLWESRSADNGTTWSAPVKTAVSNPVAPPVLTRVPGTDTLVLIQNPDVDMQSGWHGGPRRALAFRTSTDGGHTWSEPTDIYRSADDKLWPDYPAIRWIDGNLHMVWRHARDPATPQNMTGLYHHVVPAAVFTPHSTKGADLDADVCVYGATSGGVAAAVQAARMGKRVVLIEPGRHLGGMTSGGLSAVDIGDPRSVGGIAREFFTRLVARYGKTLAWDEPHKAVGGSGGGTGGAYCVEPHMAEEVFEELVKEAGVSVLREARLVEVAKEGPRINRIVVAGPDGKRREIAAKIFIDTTYEGDLMAAAGVSHTLTREGRDQCDESLAGIRYAD
jgi:predicted neuraminidase